MPLHGKDPFEFYKCRVKPGEEYFEIKFTKEHFKRYKDYIERFELYMQKIWTCSITGRKNLSFEEALLSEKLASEKVSKLPELILPHCLEFIQYKEITLEDLTTQLYDFLLMNYYPGEIVAFKHNNVKYIGRVIEHVDGSEVEDDEEQEEQEEDQDNEFDEKNLNNIKKNGSPISNTPPLISNTTQDKEKSNNNNDNNKSTTTTTTTTSNKNNKQLYSDDEDEDEEIDIDEDSNNTKSTTTTTNTDSNDKKVNRKYLDPRKKLDTMKKYYKIYVDSQGKNFIANIKDITRREPPIYKPMVKDTIKTMAKKTKHLGGYWEVIPHIMKKFNLEITPIPSHLKKEFDQYQKKKKLLAEANGQSIDSESEIEGGSDTENKKKRSADESGSANPSDQSDSEQQKKRKKSKYPIEDQDIERDEVQDKENPRPIPSSHFFCHPSTFGNFLMIWHFLNHFEKVILLTPFPLDDFELALQYHTDNPILVESHVRLLKIIFTLPSFSSGTPKKTFGNKVITDRNWFGVLKAYFQHEVKRKAIEEKEKQENLKQVEQNNKKMMILANELPGSDDEEDQDVIIQDDEDDKMKVDNENGKKEKEEKEEPIDEDIEDDINQEEEEEEEEEEVDDDEDYESEEDYKNITSPDPNIINKVLKKKSYFKLSVDERIYILSYLVQQTIVSDKIRKHLDEIVGVSNELKQEKKEVNLEEKQLKIELGDEMNEDEDQQQQQQDDEDEDEDQPPPPPVNNKQKAAAIAAANKKKQQQEKELNQLEKQKEALDLKLEKYSTRLESLGRDRIYRNYWYWSQLPGRLYIENENGEWEYYSSKQEIDDLIKFLDNRGVRERKLLTNIKVKYDQICNQLEKKNKEIIEQIQFESKRSQRIKSLYSEKSYLSYSNKYQ